jgi:hypothetical protein
MSTKMKNISKTKNLKKIEDKELLNVPLTECSTKSKLKKSKKPATVKELEMSIPMMPI